MAIRRLSRRTNRVAEGIFAGLETLGQGLTGKLAKDKAQQEQLDRQELNDYRDKVIAGTLDPDQAASAADATGLAKRLKMPASYFQTVAPTVQQKFQKAIGGIDKADSLQAVPGVQSLASGPEFTGPRRLPVLGGEALGKTGLTSSLQRGPMASVDTETEAGADPGNLPSASYSMTNSPAFQKLLTLRDEKLNSFAPTQVADTDAQGNKLTRFVASRPDQLTGSAFHPEATFEQKGAGAGRQAVSQQEAELAGNLPTLKGQAQGQENLATTDTELAGGMGTKKGRLGLQEWQANEGDAQRVQATIGQEVQKANALRPGQVALAAASAGAGERARLGVQKEMGVGDFKPVKASAEQDKSYEYGLGMVRSHNALLDLEPKLLQRPTVLTYAEIKAPNLIKDPLTQQYALAMGDYVNSIARRESGAAISESEWDRYGKRAAYTPGDTAQTLAVKQATRRSQLEGVISSSGPHSDQFVSLGQLRALLKPGQDIVQKVQQALGEGYHIVY